ncbi:hypothetical protein RJ639_025546 [Escallonia herrerae]|uniref:Uncharacterized protein n=1 Tax=Escallonia herrerae TaxID=1293975 RepID=A0AA88UWX1_9ASTE|nr:hypothetical protein RJ639_025546 [Escallonia herrerae]
MTGGVVVDDGFVHEEETHLTVFKTSLFFAGDGFTVYDCKGELVFRVESYGPDSRDRGEVVLMDAFGRCLLTARRKVQICSSYCLCSSRLTQSERVESPDSSSNKLSKKVNCNA